VKSALVLTFHGVSQNPTVSGSIMDPDAQRYVVSIDRFEQVANMVPASRCCSVTEYIEKKSGNWIVLTFDDGLRSDFELAYPLLKKKGLKGTFFVTVRNIGSNGYTTIMELKEMIDAGMEVGSHGLTHRYLLTMARKEAMKEIFDSKDELEQRINAKVESFAPVGGHYRKWMIDTARATGFKAFATMVPGVTSLSKDFTILRRNHIQSHHNYTYVEGLLRGDSHILCVNNIRYWCLYGLKSIFGLNNYDRLKASILGKFSRSFTEDHYAGSVKRTQ